MAHFLARLSPRSKRLLLATLLASSVVAGLPSEARADRGLVLDKASLTAGDRQGLERAVAAARAANPDSFRAVEEVRAEVKHRDANKRGRLAAIGPRLKELGPGALLPMLELLVLQAPREEVASAGLRALQVGLLEAVGALHDTRAESALVAMARADHADEHVGLAAARALGRLSSDLSVVTLRGLASGSAAARRRAAAGLGACRREASVAILAMLTKDPDEQTRELAIRSLGQVGNAQAWRTSSMLRAEEGPTRAAAAAALVPLFVQGDAAQRAAISVALLTIDHAETPRLLAASRDGGDGSTKAAIDRLIARFARNPAR